MHKVHFKSKKKKWKTLLMTIFLGFTGIDDVYLGKYIIGLLKFITFIVTTVILSIFINDYLFNIEIIFTRAINYASNRAKEVFPNSSSATQDISQAIKILLFIFWEIVDYLTKRSVALFIYLVISIVMVLSVFVFWMSAIISTIFGYRIDHKGNRVSSKGKTIDEWKKENDKKVLEEFIRLNNLDKNTLIYTETLAKPKKEESWGSEENTQKNKILILKNKILDLKNKKFNFKIKKNKSKK